ncbi:MAG TPA: MerR family transcriptional regulator [Solirubrobacteraceae bacterium]|nr:MerR family transcriptional regulator [Solirubrobacteraceae bacterium]
MPQVARLRIGELSRRVGESPELLRAWEKRYGIVSPERTAGGLRLYSEADARRILAMRRHIDAGLSAAEAARLARTVAERAESTGELDDTARALAHHLDLLDEPAAQAELDRLFLEHGLRAALGEAILPLLRRLGRRWAAGEVSVGQEHFASNVIGGRLRSMSRGWGDGVGPQAILACPPGELHDLGLVAFGLALRERGWRITLLGADTPIAELATAAEEVTPAIVVLAAVAPERFLAPRPELAALAARIRVGLAGAGASDELAGAVGAELLGRDLMDVAATLTPQPAAPFSHPPAPPAG